MLNPYKYYNHGENRWKRWKPVKTGENRWKPNCFLNAVFFQKKKHKFFLWLFKPKSPGDLFIIPGAAHFWSSRSLIDSTGSHDHFCI